jgi:para-nitrobenzyl esterase
MDIYVPENATVDSNLPVMVWFFGGGYVLGDGYEFGFYDGINRARKNNVIIVTPNYRLSALGFLSLDELKNEDPNASTGNYALQDQVAVLRWVRDNAAAFGGNPSAVTIFGESAGAFSVCWHLVSQASAGLFRAAIMESGQCQVPEFFPNYEPAVAWSQTYAAKVGCSPSSSNITQCLRNLSLGQLLSGSLLSRESFTEATDYIPPLYPVMPWGPVIDGSPAGLLDYPLKLILAGKWNNVPVVAGTNQNEGSLFMPMMPVVIPGTHFPIHPADFNLMLGHFFNASLVQQIDEIYPASAFSSADARGAAVLRDYFFGCAARRVLSAVRANNQSAYLYHFIYDPDWIEDPILGEYHSAELYFVWDNAWPVVVHHFTVADTAMAGSIGTYWTNLAKSQNPNQPVPPSLNWPLFQPGSTGSNILLDVPLAVETHYLSGVCEFWDTVNPRD